MENLTVKQAYLAMYAFLEDLQRKTNSDDLASFLGGMGFLTNGGTADPGAWEDWLNAVDKVLRNDDPNLGSFFIVSGR